MMAGSNDFGQIETDDGSQDWSVMSTRLNSFQTFPHSEEVPAERLARAGFYFTGESDQVRCFSCQHTVDDWHQGDNPVERHHSVSPACSFLQCVHRRNLPDGTSFPSPASIYDEDAEAREFSLRTGEVVDESAYPKIPHMKSEDARLDTFSNWPAWSPVQTHDLAQAGFFYLPESDRQIDRVQCFCCAGMLVNWEEGDDPWEEHTRAYPHCFFILGHDVGNIPSEQLTRKTNGHSSSMETFEERLESFRDKVHPINHERLARAGFTSIDDQDGVVCFKCGGCLKNWEPDDDPWVEHAKHYPGCRFLLAEKGQDFINSVQLRNHGTSSSNGFSSHEPNEDPLKKLEKLQREKLCKVCMDSDIAIVFIPCGHLVTCKKCSDSLHKCPLCCANITQKIKTYSS
ncbi:E3 ubiquitin-protein ligase XIAP [Neoarius graeffei]|uniref:E3 ubiquitin-protein ligase XIAP n=1 Tax=Neoarius graeffei TaxID=443677 RepID=UPI00298D02FA|nr:E3 ubiquitin-protein ligase XIAP [Neoarius graeffei]XP_060783955.1 E3 ubiquitin-protein ligase XIAP [Neoarius graeffei]